MAEVVLVSVGDILVEIPPRGLLRRLSGGMAEEMGTVLGLNLAFAVVCGVAAAIIGEDGVDDDCSINSKS